MQRQGCHGGPLSRNRPNTDTTAASLPSVLRGELVAIRVGPYRCPLQSHVERQSVGRLGSGHGKERGLVGSCMESTIIASSLTARTDMMRGGASLVCSPFFTEATVG